MSESNVTRFPGVTRLDGDPDIMLQDAIGKLKVGLVVGWDKEGNLYFETSSPEGPLVLWLMKLAEQMIVNTALGIIDEDA
jgi:hypothetical protein